MEAKDTVMSADKMGLAVINKPGVPMGQAIAEAQAEMSFKAGEEQGIETGRREVVDDIVKELDTPFTTPKWRILEQVEVCIGGWQAKLKERGIEC